MHCCDVIIVSCTHVILLILINTYLQQWVWQHKKTTGSPPLGVHSCGFTVVCSRVVVYGGHCGHGDCFHNSLHELDTTILKWKELSPNEAEGAPIKKCSCGMVAHSNGGEEQVCVFGGYGPLNSASHQKRAEYFADTRGTHGLGWTNEFHCFTSGEHTQCIVYYSSR